MKLDIKYNKTALREFQKKMIIRKNALPTLKNKEAALRAMVFETKGLLADAQLRHRQILSSLEPWKPLWNEFDTSLNLPSLKSINTSTVKVAGMQITKFESVNFNPGDLPVTLFPDWFTEGIAVLELLIESLVKTDLLKEQLSLLDSARKKATQKVNLYEKVQIPALESAIRQIKRYLEDEDNLSKASQKMLKSKTHKNVLI